MKRNLALFFILVSIVVYIQFSFKDQDSAHQLIPSQVSSIELKSVQIQFNQSIGYFSDDLMPVDSNKMLQVLNYFSNLKVVAKENASHYSSDDLKAMFDSAAIFKVNNIEYVIGALQVASGRIPVRRSDAPAEVFWIIDDNSVMAQYASDADAFTKRYNQLMGILSNHKFSLFQASILQHWDMLIWKSLHYVSDAYSVEINLEQSNQHQIKTNMNMAIDTDVLEQWFSAVSELKAIAYLKQEQFPVNPFFKLSFKSDQNTKWIEGHVNLQGKPGYYIRLSDQAFVYQVSQQNWQLFLLNIYSFQSRSAFKNRPHDPLQFQDHNLDKTDLRSLHTFFLSEQAQSLSLTKPPFKLSYNLQIGVQKAVLMVEGDKFVMHWEDSPLYYFYQSQEMGQIFNKLQNKKNK